MVRVDASNWAGGGALVGTVSSRPDEVDPNAGIDGNDDGIGTSPGASGIQSGVIHVGPGLQPTGETDLGPGDGGIPDNRANLTIDFAFAFAVDLQWGDSDCDHEITTRDNQALLRAVLSQAALSQTEPCPDLSSARMIDGTPRLWGDWDCDGEISTRDNQALLRNVLSQAALSQTEPCPDIGTLVQVAAMPAP